jgi:regulator of nucleoside diphosphate kinase
MMEKQLQRIVTQAISAVRPNPSHCYHLCWWRNEIRCVHAHHTTQAHPVFLSIMGQVLTAGLSADQWRVLTRRILRFCRMADLTLDELSPSSVKNLHSEVVPPSPQMTDLDCKRLQILLAVARASQPERATLLEVFQRLLETADIVPAREIPPDVVTMNSQVQLWNSDNAGEMTLSLVFPAAACGSDLGKTRLSILTHTGLSLLGRKVGDVIEGGIRIAKVLYQPEAAGDLHL